ncbi:hypothetical protein [uncultured Parasphingorhabdus sp.]|uniref:hypothetical protein n=1 Tax=uncultured Parasphingorhabdus sp. TaxID=2709694 RepID=UPI0030DA733E|tara:strand:+ start:46952 stop:47428 length:477 start_codon:yes stop_codon:yes gene_type:complete
MSRPVFLILFLIPSSAMAQAVSPEDRTRHLVEHARQLVAVDADGCLLHRTNDEIVVCGTPEIDREQRLPFPDLAGPNRNGGPQRGEIPAANSSRVASGSCGVSFQDSNCSTERLKSVVGNGKSGGILDGLQKIVGVENADVPTNDYQQQFRDGVLTGD